MDVEGLGVVFLEASAVGLPVVVGDSGGAPDAVLDGETGNVVDGRDVAAVARLVGELLGDAQRRHKLGSAGRRWVEQQWRWDLVAARLRDMLDS
jgi:phosphatidylinositol alpha-1,6-mannosyltransferase